MKGSVRTQEENLALIPELVAICLNLLVNGIGRSPRCMVVL